MAADNNIQLDRLARSFAAVGELIDEIQPGQWSAPTQCLDWSVHRLVEHLVGKNLVFTAVLAQQPLPQRGDGMPSDQLALAYRESAAVLLDAFGQPGVLDRFYDGPLGAATGAERLKIRMYDLLAHGWDLAQTLGRAANLPEDAAEESLAFARADGRAVRPGGGCFGPPRPVADTAPAIARLVAFLGRDAPATWAREVGAVGHRMFRHNPGACATGLRAVVPTYPPCGQNFSDPTRTFQAGVPAGQRVVGKCSDNPVRRNTELTRSGTSRSRT